MAAVDFSSINRPSIYALPREPVNQDYPLFKAEVADFCDEVNETAQAIINRSGHITIHDFIPKINIKMFGVFSNTTNEAERRDPNKMDGPGQAMAIVAGGIVAAIASFVFGSFYSDFQESRLRLDNCESFKEDFPEVWQIRGDAHVKDVKLVVDSEARLAESERRKALINMALTVSVIVTGALLIVAGIFASVPLALGATVIAVIIGGVAMGKFGMNFFDKTPVRQARAIAAAIDRLKAARDDVQAQGAVA